jgi:hypothetical protein
MSADHPGHHQFAAEINHFVPVLRDEFGAAFYDATRDDAQIGALDESGVEGNKHRGFEQVRHRLLREMLHRSGGRLEGSSNYTALVLALRNCRAVGSQEFNE